MPRDVHETFRSVVTLASPVAASAVVAVPQEAPEAENVLGEFGDYQPIGPSASLRQAQEWLFVLRAIGLGGLVRSSTDGVWYVLVAKEEYQRAVTTLRIYEEENRPEQTSSPRDVPRYARSSWGYVIVGLLAAFFWVTGPLRLSSPWFQRGVADASQLLHHAPWQSVTALTLHADGTHLLGNVIAGAVFFSAVHRRFGPGYGTLLTLLAGIAGNVLNAFYHGTDHRSLGTSTSVFAAIGILAATQFVLNHQAKRGALALWGPVAGGLVLLGMLGVSAHADLYAHGFGLLAGFVFGAAAAFVLAKRETPLPAWLQSAAGTLAMGIVVGAWFLAWRVR